jgi:signal transduction histidine kinase
MMRRLTLAQRLSVVFAVLLLACSSLSVWLQIQSSARYEQAVAQQLSGGLAAHIAGTAQLMDAGGWRPDAVRDLFDKLMAVNPSVEVYLLDNDGRIVGNAAPPGHLKRERVDLAPIRSLLAGESLPVLGDDPRSMDVRKVFSAAPVRIDGRPAGYVYVILLGETRDALSARLADDEVLRTTLWATAVVALLGLFMGLVAFRLITRPLRALTETVRGFDANGEQAAALPVHTHDEGGGDEIAVLRAAFAQMGQRIAEQWRELTRQDQQRRDLVANISHDLRTPLTSLHGYLETLRLKEETLSAEERRRYLDIALAQSGKVGRLAQELFELARLESGLVQPDLEIFSFPDLVQDVLQKFELSAEARGQQLSVEIASPLPSVRADLGMIERVLTNLLDNAIRHTPASTQITVRMRALPGQVQVEVSDSGPGIPEAIRQGLFTRALRLQRGTQHSGGLGLVIVQRILQLHGSEVHLAEGRDKGAAFLFTLPVGQ